jgi:amino acid adenylation domain-containing protein
VSESALGSVAVVGMACRFAGAPDVESYWDNLCRGVESVQRLDDRQLRAAGVDEATLADPRYVKAASPLEGVDLFDAPFFGLSPLEAAVMDPQHRQLLEVAWEALEAAGHDPFRFAGPVGVFAGCYASSYLLFHVASHPELLASVGFLTARILNDKDFLATRISYLCDLRGPSVSVQTACSSSLVAVHFACRSLLGFECDMALAGGVGLTALEPSGYLYQDSGIFSSDGHCRAFDADADGTLPGNGAGIVVLRRLEDALADGDRVLAVIRGTAVNNDGALKAGFTAPSTDAQAEVIATALDLAGVDPATVGYIEAHGTGTALGDPIEVAALEQVFGPAGGGRGHCGIGSVKTNLGHLDAAAGVAGLIKTVLALERGRLPPSLHFRRPNPRIDFAHGPFRVVDELADWRPAEGVRRAGVSSFGVGGTNAHVVLEQPPSRPPAPAPSRLWHLLPISARDEAALERATDRLAEHLAGQPELGLADVAFTLQTGRRAFDHRRVLVAGGARGDALAAAAAALAGRRGCDDGRVEGSGAEVVLLFPGQGAQYAGMGRGLYEGEPIFRRELDRCAELLAPLLGLDLRPLLFPPPGDAGALERADRELARTQLTQPALFLFEYALAKLWSEWGIEPVAMIGHSIGEYVAACLAGVFPLPAALSLVAARGRLIAELPAGAMLAVELSEAEAAPLAGRGLSLAAVNGPRLCVLSGEIEEVDRLHGQLSSRGVATRRLRTSHAFHSAMMEPAGPRFGREVRAAAPRPPERTVFSSLTGRPLTANEAVDPDYWVRQLRSPVRFGDAVGAVLAEPGTVLLESGPGDQLTTLAARGIPEHRARLVSSVRHPREVADDAERLQRAAGRLWLAGVQPAWAELHREGAVGAGESAGAGRRRVALPAYPFERRRYWVDRRPAAAAAGAGGLALGDAVAAPEAGAPVAARSAGRRPASAAERRLAATWQELLGVGEPSADDDFFDLGGHSLLATRLISRLRDESGVELTLKDVFSHRTLGAMAARLESAAPGDGAAGPVPVPRDGDLPASFAQRRFWLLDQLDPGNPAYNLGSAIELGGALDRAALASAVAAVCRRHESLRTTFSAESGEPRQVIHAPPPRPLPEVDLAGLPDGRRAAATADLAGREVRRPFDLARGPLFRPLLIRLGARRHVLVLDLHHAVGDGWSHGILLRELGVLYRAAAEGRTTVPELPAPALQYADYAAWQRRTLDGVRLRELVEHWRRRLEGAPPLLELPTDRPRPVSARHRGRGFDVALTASSTAALERLGRRHGATLFMVLAAGFKSVLGRWTGSADVSIGTPVANRPFPALETLIGCFVNTLVLRTDLSGDPPFSGLLGRVRETALDAFAHQEVPFERLVEELRVARSLGHAPLFQVLLSLQNDPRPALELPGLDFMPSAVDEGASRFDLTLDLAPDGDRLIGRLVFDSDLFDPSTMHRLWRHLVTLLTAAAAAPNRTIGRLPLLSPAERQQLRREWNDSDVRIPGEGCFHRRIAAVSRRAPDAVAVVGGAEHLSRGELDRRAVRLAARLRAAGAGRGSLVGVLVSRRPALVVSMLAVVEAGAAYLPLDPEHPDERLRWLLADAGADPLITEPRFAERFAETGVRVLMADQAGSPRSAGPGDEPSARIAPPSPGDAAYVIHTSGSTGRPKGVVVSHGALVNFLGSMASSPGLGEGGVLLAVTTPSFDIAALELFLPLLAGGRLVMASREEASDGALLAARLEASGATVLQATPATWRLLLAAGRRPSPALAVLCGGEAFPPELAESLAESAASVWNLYGPTETTVWSAAHRIDGPAPGAGGAGAVEGRRPVPLGRPIANTRLHVLDTGLEEAPIGVAGELYIGGAGVARGYLGRPARTAERFVPDPFDGGAAGARLYRTGDRASLDAAGRLRYLGRLDNQVKVRGFRVEPGEVEAALATAPGVAECAVAVERGDDGADRLVAYLVAEGAPPATEPLRRALGRVLPPHMVPSAYVLLPALPRTANGKLDRNALDAAAGVRAASERQFAPPRTPLEELVADAWRDQLGVDRVGRDDDFFALGGHSLLATRMMARLRRTMGIDVALRELFDRPTLGAFVAGLTGVADPARPPLAAGSGDRAPLSFAQERLFFLYRLDPSNPAYNLAVGLHFEGRLELERLAAAATLVAARQGSLRTIFRDGAGGAEQELLPPEPVAAVRIDLAALGAERADAEARRRAAEEAARPFDLDRRPAFRLIVLHLGAERHVLVLATHHLVCDGRSLDLLIDELAEAYAASAGGRAPRLPELPVRYADFAGWQRSWLGGELLRGEIDHWRRRLAGAPAVTPLPVDRPRRGEQSFRGSEVRFEWPRELAERLTAFARTRRATLSMTLLAAYAALLHARGGMTDLVVGTPIGYRNWPEIEPLVGFFANTLVLRIDLAGDPGFESLLDRVREVLLTAFSHQDLPFNKLVGELGVERRLDRNPLFQVGFTFDSPRPRQVELPGVRLTPWPFEVRTTQFDLNLVVLEGGGSGATLGGALQYSTDLFDRATVEGMVADYGGLLEHLAGAGGDRLSELSHRVAEEVERRGRQAGERAAARGLARFQQARRRAVTLDPVRPGGS